MGEARPAGATSMLVRILVALAQGVVLWVLFEAAANDLWPADRRGWLVGLIAAGVLLPLAHYVIADLAPASRQWPVLAGLALLALGLGWHHGAWGGSGRGDDVLPFAVPLGVLVFHAMPFVQCALTGAGARPAYGALFHFAWRNALLGALGALFAGVFWLLLMLWGQLFHMLGIDAFRDLFATSAFAVPATTVAVGVGVQLAGSVERLQVALRQQILALLKWLAPLAILILVLFTLTLLGKSPELFAEQRRAISALWLLWLVALTVALLNAAYQDGGEAAPYPRWLGTAVRFASILLLPVALLAVYALGVRIAGYGLTASRGWGLLVAVVALGYAGGYAWAALRRGAWMAGMGAVNVAIALFTIAMLTLMLTPVLSPERLAAASQERRVRADPRGDAYAELRFRSGRYGRERLAGLAAIEHHPRAALIRARAAAEMRRDEPWSGAADAVPLDAAAMVALPEGSPLDPGLVAAFDRAARPRGAHGCAAQAPCPVLFVDLDRDGSAEAVLFGPHRVAVAARTAAGWRLLDRVAHASPLGTHLDRDALTRALREGRYRLVDPPWLALEVEGHRVMPYGPAAADGDCPAADGLLSRGLPAARACP